MKVETLPKIIHYCWFGGNELGEQEQKCIESWKKFLPEYEIVRWDESNFDLAQNSYVHEAYEAKKWAFISDFARFDILHQYGGLYFDTDVEIVASLNDILDRGPFMASESAPSKDHGLTVAPGLGLAAYPGMALYQMILDSYKDQHFINDDGSLNTLTVVARVTDLLRGCGLQDVNEVQTLGELTIYPTDYFNPKDYFTGEIVLTHNTRAIHHFSMSWVNDVEKYKHSVVGWCHKHGIKGMLAFKLSGLAALMKYGVRSGS